MASKYSPALVTLIQEKVKQLLIEGGFYKDYFFPANDWRLAQEIHSILQSQPTAYKDNISEESTVIYYIQEYIGSIELLDSEKWAEGRKITRKIAEFSSFGTIERLSKGIALGLLGLPLDYKVALCTGLASDKIKNINVRLSDACEIIGGPASPNQELSNGRADAQTALLNRLYSFLDVEKLGKGNVLWLKYKFKGYIASFEITDTEMRVKREIMEVLGLLYVYRLIYTRQYFKKVVLFPLHYFRRRKILRSKEFDLEMSTALSNSIVYEEFFSMPILFTKQRFSSNKIVELRLKDLVKFLSYSNKREKEYLRIKNALYWLVLGMGSLKPKFSLICLITAIESVEGKFVNDARVTNKQEHLANTISALLSSSFSDRKSIYESVKSFYDKRNSIVHDGAGDEMKIDEITKLLVLVLSLVNKEIALLIH